MSYRSKSSPVLIDVATSANWASVANCNKTVESVELDDGSTGSAIRFSGLASNTNTFFDFTLGATLSGRRGIEFDIKVDFGTFAQMVSSPLTGFVQLRDAGGTNNAAAITGYTRGWQRVRLDRADFDNLNGTPHFDNTSFASLRFKLNAVSGMTHNCWIRNVSWSGNSRSQFCIHFDDIGNSVYQNAFPYMASRKLVGSLGCITDAVGQTNWNGYDRISSGHMLEMVGQGWDVGFHTKQHLQNSMAGWTVSQCETEYSYNAWIADNGLSVSHDGNWASHLNLYSPYGEYSVNMFAAAENLGMNLFRGVIGNTGQSTQHGASDLVTSRTMVPTYVVANTTTFAAFKATIDRSIARGGSMIILFHHILPSASTSIECATSVFQQMMDYLYGLSGVADVVNMPTFMSRTAKAGMSSVPIA